MFEGQTNTQTNNSTADPTTNTKSSHNHGKQQSTLVHPNQTQASLAAMRDLRRLCCGCAAFVFGMHSSPCLQGRSVDFTQCCCSRYLPEQEWLQDEPPSPTWSADRHSQSVAGAWQTVGKSTQSSPIKTWRPVEKPRDNAASVPRDVHPMDGKQSFPKTRLCQVFAAGGQCRRGERCPFAHGTGDLRKPAPVQLGTVDRCLADAAKRIQRHSKEYSMKWEAFCDRHHRGRKNPFAHNDSGLESFIDSLGL